MKTTLVVALAALLFGMPECHAQEPASSSRSAPATDESAVADESAEPGTIESGDRELTRAERRELRRSERDARLAAEAVASAEDTAGAEEADEGVICRRETVTGSHRSVRICTTRAEREAARESARDAIREIGRPQGGLGPEGN